MSEWQPIETAPRNGSPILCAKDDLRFIARWWRADDTGGWSLDLGGDDECIVLNSNGAPTHWQPLPDPPATDAQKQDDSK